LPDQCRGKGERGGNKGTSTLAVDRSLVQKYKKGNFFPWNIQYRMGGELGGPSLGPLPNF